MRPSALFGLAALVVLLSNSSAQDLYTLPLPANGAVVVETRGGEIVSLRPTKLWTGLPPTSPPTSPPSDPPTSPSNVRSSITSNTKATLSQGGTELTAVRLATALSFVGSALDSGDLSPTATNEAVKRSLDAALAGQPDAALWQSWRNLVTSLASQEALAGRFTTGKQQGAFFAEVNAGVRAALPQGALAEADAAQDGLPAILDNFNFDTLLKILELIKQVREILEELKTIFP